MQHWGKFSYPKLDANWHVTPPCPIRWLSSYLAERLHWYLLLASDYLGINLPVARNRCPLLFNGKFSIAFTSYLSKVKAVSWFSFQLSFQLNQLLIICNRLFFGSQEQYWAHLISWSLWCWFQYHCIQENIQCWLVLCYYYLQIKMCLYRWTQERWCKSITYLVCEKDGRLWEVSPRTESQ